MIIFGKHLVKSGSKSSKPAPLLCTDVALSFWGGVDPETGKVIDASHPLHGKSIAGCILCLPSGRGSCTASQVLLELILRKKAPKAIIMRDLDGLVCVGAIVAQEFFEDQVPDILCVRKQKFDTLLKGNHSFGIVGKDGALYVGSSSEEVRSQSMAYDSLVTVDDSEAMLSDEEARMLDSVSTNAERMALKVLIRFAQLETSTPKYLDIGKAHIDGCTYIGPGGLAFVRKLMDGNGKVKVPTTLNSVSADRRQWQRLGVDAELAKASIELGDAYLELGCQQSFTCAPYLLSNPPEFGENIIWGESNAVVYSNSVLGARTEKYADYLDICCAIVGKVPASGVHLAENRRPQIVLDATEILRQLWGQYDPTNRESVETTENQPADLDLDLLFPTIGHLCGTLSDGLVPLLVGFEKDAWSSLISADHLKSFCAAFGTTGTSPIIHIAGITPEVRDHDVTPKLQQSFGGPTRVVKPEDLDRTFLTLNGRDIDRSEHEKIDLIALGNPHLSVTECENLALLVDGKSKRSTVRVMACISRPVQQEAQRKGHIVKLQNFGIEFVNDTCWCMMLDPPIIPARKDATILTNSGKYAHYGPGLTNRRFRLGSMVDCIDTAVTGMYGSVRDKRFSQLMKAKKSVQGRTYSTVTVFPNQQGLSSLKRCEHFSKVQYACCVLRRHARRFRFH